MRPNEITKWETEEKGTQELRMGLPSSKGLGEREAKAEGRKSKGTGTTGWRRCQQEESGHLFQMLLRASNWNEDLVQVI